MYCKKKFDLFSIIFFVLFFSKLSFAELSSFTANYKLQTLSVTQAYATTKLSIKGDNYRFESRIKPTAWIGIINNADRYEYSEGVIKNNEIIPQKYYYQHSDWLKSTRQVEITFDKQKNKITNYHLHINNKWKMDSVDQVQDRLSSQLSIILALQQSGTLKDKKEFSYSIADGGRLKQYIFTIIAEEKLQTPLGVLNTIKLEHHRSHQDGIMIIWCAEDLAYLPVKIQHQQLGLPNYISVINSYTKN